MHSGPVNEVADLNEQVNIAGAGVNIAQRVMDCGDAGHILLSKRVADDLSPYPKWNSFLHDLGECEVKHGEKISLVNFYTDDVGNPQPPLKCQLEKSRTSNSVGGDPFTPADVRPRPHRSNSIVNSRNRHTDDVETAGVEFGDEG